MLVSDSSVIGKQTSSKCNLEFQVKVIPGLPWWNCLTVTWITDLWVTNTWFYLSLFYTYILQDVGWPMRVERIRLIQLSFRALESKDHDKLLDSLINRCSVKLLTKQGIVMSLVFETYTTHSRAKWINSWQINKVGQL